MRGREGDRIAAPAAPAPAATSAGCRHSAGGLGVMEGSRAGVRMLLADGTLEHRVEWGVLCCGPLHLPPRPTVHLARQLSAAIRSSKRPGGARRRVPGSRRGGGR